VISLAILGALISVACYLAAREIQGLMGIWPALLFLFVLFLFYRRFAGATMTENLGLPLGVSAFVILWGSAQRKNLILTALGC
jgi:asparagine N-glycosylation enzyme membrane subunit Stt3